MPGENLIEALERFLLVHPRFLLSEFVREAATDSDPEAVASTVWPFLTGMSIVTEPRGRDLLLTRKTPQEPRCLDQAEQAGIEKFLRNPAVPQTFQEAVEQYIEKKTGKSWNDPIVLERIRKAVVLQKDEYWKEREKRRISYRKGYGVLGYLAYQAPGYMVQFEHLLYLLAGKGLLFPHMRVLDAGTGPGVVPIAIDDFLERIGGCGADLFSVEQSGEFLEAFRFLTDTVAGRRGRVLVHAPLERDLRNIAIRDIPPSLDLIVFQNVLNELSGLSPVEKGDLVAGFAKSLALTGSILLIEPADLSNSTELRKVVAAVEKAGLFLHAPCRFLWGGERCRPDHCWSFVEKAPIRPTRLMEALATGLEGYRYRNTDIKFSYALLRKVPPPPPSASPSSRRFARLSTLQRHLNRRVNVAATVMSGNLGDSRTSVFLVCDGTSKKPVYAILHEYHKTPNNERLLSLPNGAAARFCSVLVRHNPRFDSYNLLVTRESRISDL
jgi:hypothetical protein